MPRQRDPRRDEAFEIWKASGGEMKLKDIAAQLGVSDTQVRKWKNLDQWEQKLKGNVTIEKRNVTKNNGNVTEKQDDISWVEIENEYVTDIRKKPCTLKDLAEKYNISVSRIEKYAAENDWKEKRRKYAETVQKKTKEKAVIKTSEILSDDISAFTARHLRVSDKLISIIEQALEDENELYKYVEKLRQGYGQGVFQESIVVEVNDALNDGKLVNIVSSLEKLQKMQRQTLGILDAKDQHRIEMDRQEFELKRKELEGSTDTSTRVVIINDTDEMRKVLHERSRNNSDN
ncbi:phage terminase small subunit-related protein [Parageobacillus thermoglucosidasius]|uniref:phage terminase small subunit-related protein n=1 Tax=Parageobacillus thermoglucosidasius TaxID=1426 RepID=UPI001C8A35B4|nr:phage terminase small subunit-related protein [Parageobacillus thermoglucosidasius]MED4904112.1 phage terminase small subunit-related protein [Parageobacillus thermoglucosidasius]MED4915662.1 phage terminase small subunit-related protein [Parageobacillus thermoglucosidasius]MED4945073.1 phage terminase small subunit-related protein [Parageobacillus thermoglucosidasius]MED4983730.1 phage terminase small subunit-related protein [Parageobacillus thermoglucosidasius]